MASTGNTEEFGYSPGQACSPRIKQHAIEAAEELSSFTFDDAMAFVGATEEVA